MAKSFGFPSISVSLTMLQTKRTGVEGGQEEEEVTIRD